MMKMTPIPILIHQACSDGVIKQDWTEWKKFARNEKNSIKNLLSKKFDCQYWNDLLVKWLETSFILYFRSNLNCSKRTGAKLYHHHHHHHHHLRLSSLVSHSWGWMWYMSCLHCFLSSAIYSVMFNFFISSSTTLLQVFFVLPTGFLPSTSSSITLLSMLFSSLRFTWPNHLNLIFLNLSSRFSTLHLLLTSGDKVKNIS